MGKIIVPAAQMELLNTINKVDGFDPEAFTTEYTDLNSNESRKHLPVMAQMAWFRLKYPEGKIAVSIESGNNCFVATARVYPSYKDPVECYLSEATASRGTDPSKPTVSPREWAQTAAVGIALRNAGFGLQFGAAGDEFTNQLPNEFSSDVPPVFPQVDPPVEVDFSQGQVSAPPVSVKKELTPEEKYQQACAVMWPNKKFEGRTLGEVLLMDPSAINWLANKYMNNPEASAAAKFMCEYAMKNAGA